MLVGPAATDRNMKVVSEPELPEIKGQRDKDREDISQTTREGIKN